MFLSILIPCLNDTGEVFNTVESIRATSPADEVEIVVVDDCSTEPLRQVPTVGNKQIRNEYRIGAGASRHVAAEAATGTHIMLTDAHMRFEPGWYEEIKRRLSGQTNVAYCGSCLGLDKDHRDVMKPNGVYTGARLTLYEEGQVFAGRWLPSPPEDDAEISCLMGACYFMPRDLFLRVGGTRDLRMWGTEEEYLSVKLWLAGAEIRYAKSVRIGHFFRGNTPYSTEMWNLIFNKALAIEELFDRELADKLILLLPQNGDLSRAIIELAGRSVDRLYQVKDARWYLDKFKIKIP